MAWALILAVLPPEILLIHLNGNNQGFLVKNKALILQVQDNMKLIRHEWPAVQIICSTVLPCRSWRRAWDSKGIKKAQPKANMEI